MQLDSASHDHAPIENLNVAAFRSIVTPLELSRRYPLTDTARSTVLNGRNAVRNILQRKDNRLLAVVGPCSVHDVGAAEAYARMLAGVAAKVNDRMLVLMRVYFEKPRTTIGWKGLINDPHLDGTFDVSRGLELARKLLLSINDTGLPSATELLEPITPQYIDDLVTWAAIGARTTESQTHRQMASGLSMPVGYKNGTEGQLQVAIDAMLSAKSSHHFLGVDDEGRVCIVKTRGNQDGHVILRGGQGRPNYDPANVAEAAERLAKANVPAVLMVDCSHANSGKKHEHQGAVWRNVVDQVVASRKTGTTTPIIGLMLESNLSEGRQEIPSDLTALKYGVSVTDACIGWDETEALLMETYEQLT